MPANKAVRDNLLAPVGKEMLGKVLDAKAIEVPQKWCKYAVVELPQEVRTLDSTTGLMQPVLTADSIKEEVVAQTARRPVSCRKSRHGPNPMTGLITWIVSFLEPVPRF
ncbi:hypothetical protein K470DRAFT_262114 [Piedraia hortae CBS 480.64]|uniref:Uncharacterized protein n=1 Tax=Piedraia hortae CBS 480.64 TaxID=1314780 RepID=A0A6A7C7Y0_9PEZI|nr:hypothetical protein K470DRAFT_262114 [Piedraia hortae CBS 480.64]